LLNWQCGCLCVFGCVFECVRVYLSLLPFLQGTQHPYTPLCSAFGSLLVSSIHIWVCVCVCVYICSLSILPRMWLIVSDARGIILIMTEQHDTSILLMSSPTGVCVCVCVCVCYNEERYKTGTKYISNSKKDRIMDIKNRKSYMKKFP